MRNNFEERFDGLLADYKHSFGDHGISANFSPMLWQKIEARRVMTFSFERLAQKFVTAAVALCLLMGLFLITRLPKYLDEVFHVDLEDVGRMQSVPLIASCLGMACGGWFADAMYRRLGPRWGRTVPISLVLFVCAAAYLLATMMSSAWAVIALLSLMAFFVDLGVPSIWAFAQDVGGRQVGAALGWGNMWGNFGATLSPVVLFAIRDRYGWDVVFYACAGCFVLAGLAALNLNATVPVLAEDRDRSR